jgi:hypothetical protein
LKLCYSETLKKDQAQNILLSNRVQTYIYIHDETSAYIYSTMKWPSVSIELEEQTLTIKRLHLHLYACVCLLLPKLSNVIHFFVQFVQSELSSQCPSLFFHNQCPTSDRNN